MLSATDKSPVLKVLVSVSALLIMIVIYSIWSIYSSSEMAVRAGEQQAAGYTKALSEHAERAFSEADAAVVETIRIIQSRGGLDSFNSKELYELTKDQADDTPQIGSIVVINAKGQIFAHSLGFPLNAVDISDRDFFKFHRDNPGKGLFISRPFKGRIVNKWRFNLSRPIFDPSGNFQGVVAVAFNIEYFQQFYRTINLGSQGRIVLVHRDSPVLVMEPFSEKNIALDYSNSVLFKEKLPKSKSGTFHLERGTVVNSPARIISYMTLTEFPVIAIVSLSRDEIMAPWKSVAIKQAISTMILCIAVIVLALLHLRQLRRLEKANGILLDKQKELESAEQLRKDVEAQLIHAQKMESIGQLAGGVAHDFNNLLTPIIGYSELLKASGCRATGDMGKLDAILGAAMRAKELTKQLLGFARKQIMSMSVIDINKAILSFHTILRRVVRESVDIQMHLALRPMLVRADQSQIEHVLLNLAVNAQDAIIGHGSITIATSHITLEEQVEGPLAGLTRGIYVVVTVSDSGSGIDSEHLEHIFEPFFTTKPAGHGTGLGLAMVYGIIKQHEGAITVESSIGEGTIFRIYLPETEDSQEFEVTPLAVDVKQSVKSRVLVVEDNEMVRDMVVHILTLEGHQVTDAESAEQALKIVDDSAVPFDLLVSDVVMPGMNGPGMYSNMLKRTPGLKALFISGYTNDPVLMAAVDSESAFFLHKPFSVDDLLAKVRESLI